MDPPQKGRLLKIVSIEGNIGAGKTTIMNHLKAAVSRLILPYNIIFVPEPIEEWTSKITLTDYHKNVMPKEALACEMVSPLQHMYDGIRTPSLRSSFMFQIVAFASRMRKMEEAIASAPKDKNFVLVCERGLLSDNLVFTRQMISQGLISPHEAFAYNMVWETHYKRFEDLYAGFLVIHASPKVCLARTQKRGRAGECNVTLEYLEAIEQRHAELVKEYGGELKISHIGNEDEEYLFHISDIEVSKFIGFFAPSLLNPNLGSSLSK